MVLVVAVRTRVLLECPLREAVEGEGGDGAFEIRGNDAPRAVGATPAGEVITFDPDQTFIHTSTFCACVLGFVLGRGGAEHINRSSAEGGLLPAGGYFPRICNSGK